MQGKRFQRHAGNLTKRLGDMPQSGHLVPTGLELDNLKTNQKQTQFFRVSPLPVMPGDVRHRAGSAHAVRTCWEPCGGGHRLLLLQAASAPGGEGSESHRDAGGGGLMRQSQQPLRVPAGKRALWNGGKTGVQQEWQPSA